MSATAEAGVGSPAVMNGISALRPSRRSVSNVAAIRDTLEIDAELQGDGMHVLVSATRQIDEQDALLRQPRRHLRSVGERMRRFERRNDAFEPAKILECLQ